MSDGGIRKGRGFVEVERYDIGLRVSGRGVISAAYLQGDDTEWYHVALTREEKMSVALTLLTGRATVIEEARP